MTGPRPPTRHELVQQQIDAQRLWRLANPDFNERLRQRMTAKGRWSQRAEAAAEQQTSIAEQRRTEQAAAAADKSEQAWVLSFSAEKSRRDRGSSPLAWCVTAGA